MASSESSFEFLDPPSQPGDLGTLSHYRVIEELGRGGMGYVFRAQDKRLQRDVALKVMNQKVAGTPFSRRRFIHEARAMAAVHHDNVATIFEVGETAGTPFMAMEMLQGSTLEKFNDDDQRLGFEEVIRYAEQIARGLAAAHAQGIVHRDIKPANIWIEPHKDRIKILDFGLALAATPVDQLAGRGAVIGTPGYLSPEQARTEPLDDRSDLYSLGVVLYELCTGCLPLQSSTVSGQLIAILTHRPRPMLEVNPEVPVPLADLIHRLLYKEPRARVRSAEALVKELTRVEKECHAQSAVAQTINQLQQGLDAVVSKQVLPIEPDLGEVLDPFASVPDMPAAAATKLPATAPVNAGPRAATPYPKRPVARASAKPNPNWQKYLPFAAIGAVVLLALPIMAFAFSYLGGSNEPVLLSQQTSTTGQNRGANKNDGANKNNSAKQSGAGTNPNKGGQNRAAPNGQANKQGNAQGKNNTQARKNNQAKNRQNRNATKNDGQPRNANNGNRNKAAATTTNKNNPRRNAGYSSGMTNQTSANPAPRNEGSAAKPKPVAKPAVRTNKPPTRVASVSRSTEPPVGREMQWSTISTGHGRGADTMVQIGTSNKFGTKPSIGIHKRGDVESHHSYLRFDLKDLKEVKSDAAKAELILTMVGRARPQGATIRLHGIPGKGIPIWPEEGPRSPVWSNTPSKTGLDSLPVLATVTVTGQADPRDGAKNTVRLTSPKLVAFIRDCEDDTLNLVIAGDSNGPSPLRFVSHEASAEKAPFLMIEAPKESLRKKGQNNNQARSGR